MILTMINTHKAYKALQDAGVNDRQAEVMVEIFAEMQQENALTKSDLSQALEGVVRSQNATNNRLEKLEGKVEHFKDEVKSQLQAVDMRFDKLETHIDERFKKVDEQFEKIDERFEKIDGKFEKIDEKFERIDAKFEKINVEFKRVDGEFKKVSERFNGLENRMEMGFNELKGEMVWLRRILVGATAAIFLSAIQYIFNS